VQKNDLILLSTRMVENELVHNDVYMLGR